MARSLSWSRLAMLALTCDCGRAIELAEPAGERAATEESICVARIVSGMKMFGCPDAQEGTAIN